MTPQTMWAIACDSLRDRVLAADFEAQARIAVEGAEKLLAFARRLAGVDPPDPVTGQADPDTDMICEAIEDTARALDESRRGLAATRADMESLGPRIDALERTLAEALARADKAEAEVERLKDLMQQVCEPCAFGEARRLDPVFGIYAHDGEACGIDPERRLRKVRHELDQARMRIERLCAALGRTRGMLYSVKFGDWRLSELDEVIEATSYAAFMEEDKE